jgi:hypothetical protein
VLLRRSLLTESQRVLSMLLMTAMTTRRHATL